MSLRRIFSDLLKRELGLFSVYQRNYRYVFCDDKSLPKMYAKLKKRLHGWTMEKIMETFPAKEDDRGRKAIFQFGQSMPCFLELASNHHPVQKGICLVPLSDCKKCPYRKQLRGKYFCEVLRNKNRGLTLDSITGAFKKAEEIMGGKL